MNLKGFSKYIGFFITGVLLIAVYKTFDNLSIIWNGAVQIFQALSPFLFGALTAFLLYNPCRKVEVLLGKTKIGWLSAHRRGIAVAVVYLFGLLLLSGFFALLVPALVKSISDLLAQAPALWQKILDWLKKAEEWGLPLDQVSQSVSPEALVQNFDVKNVSRYAQSVWSAGEGIFNFLMSVIVSVYILLDRHNIKKNTARLVNLFLRKDRPRRTFYKYTGRAFEYMNAYVACKVIDAGIIGVASFFIMLPFGVPYLALMAIIQAVFNLIPYFGAVISTLIAAGLTAITVSPGRGIWVAVALVLLQQIDANILQPRLVHETMDIHPLWVIFSILLFGALFGLWGILLGVPVMALILSAIEDGLHLAERRKEKSEKN